MGRTENIAVYQDTEKLCKTNSKIKEFLKESVKEQQVILEGEELAAVDDQLYKKPAKVVVSKKRSFEAAAAYKEGKTLVHNFASASNPGGGVQNGASAQEECLCRCSDLFFCLNEKLPWEGFYGPHRVSRDPLHNDDIIYTPGVLVFKSDTAEPKLMKETDWYQVDVITCAAPNLRSKPSNTYNTGDGLEAISVQDEDLMHIHEKRLRRMLDVAILHGVDNVILGAFGCGAFMNKPEVVAKAYQNVIGDYLYAFANIEFAVYCSPRDEQNYMIFKKALS